jgi:hypothetical protein
MAIVTGSLSRILLKYPHLDLSKVRLVGWGAGQFFHYQYPFLKNHIQLEYTVCPNPSNQGRTLMGVEVRSPDALHQEPSDTTIVVIFAERYYDVMHALRDQFNDLLCVNACSMADDVALVTEMEEFRQLELAPVVRKWKRAPRLGIFIQGMAMEHTPYVLAWNRFHHPDAYQCMVTWDHLDPNLLDRCRPWLDQLTLVSAPQHPGLLYLNAGLRSARLGVEHLAEQGIEFAVRCRSDCILSGSLQQVIERHFSRERNLGKIAVSIQGWQNIPFMFSEKAMVARTPDLVKLWSMPEDIRGNDDHSYKIPGSAHFLELRHAVPECLLWSRYAGELGYKNVTLEDSQDFLRARLLPLEPDLHWSSLKFVPLFHVSAESNHFYSLAQWNQVYANSENVRERAHAVQSLDMSVDEFWLRKIG